VLAVLRKLKNHIIVGDLVDDVLVHDVRPVPAQRRPDCRIGHVS
jgi:hypothetical protein